MDGKAARAVATTGERAPRDEDRALLARMARGDTSALDTIVREMYVPLCRFAYRITGTRETAQDVVADALAGFWERVQRSGATTSMRSYLYRAVRNRALNAVRDARRSATVPLDEALSVADDRPMDRSDELDIALRVSIDALPERCRMTYILSREQQLTHSEIAAVMDVSIKTVEAQLARALTRLRESLAPYLD